MNHPPPPTPTEKIEEEDSSSSDEDVETLRGKVDEGLTNFRTYDFTPSPPRKTKRVQFNEEEKFYYMDFN